MVALFQSFPIDPGSEHELSDGDEVDLRRLVLLQKRLNEQYRNQVGLMKLMPGPKLIGASIREL